MHAKIIGVIVAIALIVCAMPGTAVATNGNVFNDLQPFVAIYNEQVVDDLPPFVEKLVADQRINGVVYLYDAGGNNPYRATFNGRTFVCYGSVVIGVVTDSEGRIVEFSNGEITDPTMHVAAYDTVIYGGMQSLNPLCDLITAKNNGWITIKGVGIRHKAQVMTINALAQSFGRLRCGIAG